MHSNRLCVCVCPRLAIHSMEWASLGSEYMRIYCLLVLDRELLQHFLLAPGIPLRLLVGRPPLVGLDLLTVLWGFDCTCTEPFSRHCFRFVVHPNGLFREPRQEVDGFLAVMDPPTSLPIPDSSRTIVAAV